MSSFFKEVTDLELLYNPKSEDSLKFGVSALPGYLPNSLIYTIFYLLALPPNICLLYMGLRTDLITSRVKFPTLGMTLANLFGLVGFLTLNFVYLYAVITERIVGICFAIPMAVAIYDLFLQDVILYDYMFKYIRMSLYTNMFFFLVLAPSFFAFSFICNILVLLSIIQRQSKTSRKQCGRSLNPRQLQQHKSIIYTYILQAFLPLALATPYYIACLCLMYDVDIPLVWFIVGEGIISLHPLSNALITLILLRPYREAFKKLIRRGFKQKSHPNWPSKIQRLLSAPPEINTDTEGENNNKKIFYKTAIVTNKDGEEPFCATYNNVTAVSL
uniref:G-protein coupled receptors family 1 profile domain-containing protein n=1 Tax=Meloidogyne javanica TaxID=6303 RepID=A0A915LNJ1_MELJA